MQIVNSNIKWIMLISGGLTFTMIFAVIAPHQALSLMFGTTLEGPLSEIIVRNWGALVAMVGGLLVYGAFHEGNRNLALAVAVLSKILFISLVITNGFGAKMLPTIALDAIVIVLFSLYLLSNRKGA